ncbi:family 43 glycosylhydrolase [Streptomyces sp. DSM 40750]|uniref:family 43 glycosylhydrolase n=1 Tax=Streptomyces sp. DSM 40750 TaxID=2801030 RepID=UPI00214C18F3|nr:family 43 glycosylhydrolase [Streptomyces sp. DSM 40750]UUU20135.1 family 43 glycosylhydrolase [Streptomyces sp. DSM 40750]
MTRSRCLSAFIAALTMAVAFLVAPQPAAAAVAFTSTGVNQNGGNCLDLPGGSTADGAQLRAFACGGGANQSLGFAPVAGTTDTYTITTRSGQCVDVHGASTADNAAIIQWPCHGATNQRWRLVPVPAGGTDKTFNLVSVGSGKCVTPSGGSSASNTNLVQLPCATVNGRVWRLPGFTGDGTAPKTFTNPLAQRGPDPWLTYHEGFYYLATTTWNSTITMRKAGTLAGLATATDQVIFNLTRPNGAGTMWAPEFHLLDGPNGKRWYFYYTAGREPYDLGTQRIHVLESAGLDPMGPYTFKADLLDPTQDNTWELDPGILQLDGKLYLLGTYYNGSQPMFIRPLSNPWTASGTRRVLSTPTYSWETVGGAVNEGAEVLQRGGKTFIIYSASHCSTPDYKLGMLTYNGGDPLNSSSWVKSPNPVFQRSNANGVYGPGHNGFFKSPDGTEDWMVYHANSSASGGCDMNRSTRAQKFTWNADGTPDFGTPVPLGVTLTAPSGE